MIYSTFYFDVIGGQINGYSMRLELTLACFLARLTNHYTTRGSHIHCAFIKFTDFFVQAFKIVVDS